MPRCNDCNKFVSLDTDTEPEESSSTLSFSGNAKDGTMTADYDVDIRITNNCAECDGELKQAELNASGSFEIDVNSDEYDEDEFDNWTIEVTDLSRTETGGGDRYSKKYYGFEGKVVLQNGEGEELETVEISDNVQASGMDDV